MADNLEVKKIVNPHVYAMKPRFSETAEVGLEFQYKHGISNSENPDKIISSKGMDYIEDLERDTHLSSVMNTRIQAVLSKGWNVKPHSEKGKVSNKDAAIRNFVLDQLEHIPTFETDIVAMFDAISKGYSLSEINPRKVNSGNWTGKIGLKDIRFKAAKNFSFKFDKFGHFDLRQVDPSDKDLDINKFIHYINGRDDENPWGESVTSKAAFWIWLKKNVAKFWAVFAERFGMPFVNVKIPNNCVPGTPEYTKALDYLDAVLKDSGAVVPEGFAAELLEAMRTGDANYNQFIERANKEISKVVLGQTLTTEEGKRGQGSYALGSVHAGVLANYTLFDVLISAAVINNQLIKRLVDWNFVTEHYPKFEWKVFDIGKVTVIAQNIQNLANVLDIPISFVYDYLGIPIPAAGEPILQKTASISQPEMPIPKGVDNKAIQKKAEQEGRESFATKEVQSQLAEMVIKQQKNVAENKKIEKILQAQLAAAYENIQTKIVGLNKLKEDKISDFVKTETAPIIQKIFVLGKLQGLYHAKLETGQIDEIKVEFASEADIYDPFQKLIDAFLANEVLTKEEFEKLTEEMKRRSFTIAGVESEYVLEKVRDEMAAILKSGGGWKELTGSIQSVLEKAGLASLNSYHLENVVRTNLQTLYSRGREEIYAQVDEEDFPYKTVLTIPDERRRESHAKLHGFTRPLSDPIWQVLKTPFSYQCRCVIIAVHKSQGFTVSDWMPDMSDLDFVRA